jgi:hypothetical protein
MDASEKEGNVEEPPQDVKGGQRGHCGELQQLVPTGMSESTASTASTAIYNLRIHKVSHSTRTPHNHITCWSFYSQETPTWPAHALHFDGCELRKRIWTYSLPTFQNRALPLSPFLNIHICRRRLDSMARNPLVRLYGLTVHVNHRKIFNLTTFPRCRRSEVSNMNE